MAEDIEMLDADMQESNVSIAHVKRKRGSRALPMLLSLLFSGIKKIPGRLQVPSLVDRPTFGV